MDFTGSKETIEKIIQDAAADLGYMIYESSVLLKGEQSKLVIKIDSPGGISHKDCSIFNKEMIKRLDNEKILPNYSMEISSPGLSRKLRSIDEFIRFKGSPVKVIFESEGESKVIKGIINNIIDTDIELKSDNKEIIIDYKTIRKANLEY